MTCLDNDKARGGAFNFCTGKGITIEDLVHKIGELVGVEAQVIPSTIPKRPLDIRVLVGDNSKAKQVLGWSPKFALEQGLQLATVIKLTKQL